MNNQLHVHGRQSGFDSGVEYSELMKRAKEIGTEAIALTDHGTLTGIYPFIQACNEANIKPILGVEAYVQEDSEASFKSHMIIMAKDNVGYRSGICKAVTMSNKRIDSKGAPRMNEEILRKSFGKGTPAHGRVVITTACMQGVCNSILLSNQKLQTKIEKIRVKQDKYMNPGDALYGKRKERLEELESMIIEKRQLRDEFDKISKRSVKKMATAVESAKGTSEYEKLKESYDEAVKMIEDASAEKEKIKIEINDITKAKNALSKEIKKFEESMDKWIEYDEEIETLSKNILSDEKTYEMVEKELDMLCDIFGKENVFVEMQYHGIPDEAKCMPILAKIAKKKGLPLVAANDVHMVYGDSESRRKRQILRSLRYNKWEDEFTGDSELYVKTDEELLEMLLKILPKEMAEEAIANINKVVDMCNYTPTKEEHYPKYKSEIVGETANAAIRRIATKNIEWRFPGKVGWTKEYEKRLEYELDIICGMGYADYHLIVQDFLNFGRKLGRISYKRLAYITKHIKDMTLKELVEYVDNNQTEVGLTIGPGRGSAVGSLVCYLLGITSIDPIKYGLIFERFLNPERVSMPKIYWAFNVNTIAQWCA